MRLGTAEGALLDAVRHVRWPARRRAPHGMTGAHLSKALGTSAEFTEHRAYRQGDEPRRIDWKLLARSDRVAVRLSDDRATLPTVLLVDASASMAFPADTLEKWAFARLVAVGLAAAAHRSGDPVGVTVAAADGARRLPPRTRPGVVHDVARALDALRPSGSPALAPLLAGLRSVPRVAVITDLLGDADELLAVAAASRAAGREVHLVHVVHALEADPPAAPATYADPERPEDRRALTGETRAAYLERFAAWRTDVAHAWRAAGAWYTEVGAGEAAERAVRRVASGAG
ncbi:MAG: DUF58 domain-containing protein [Gemmatimonadaceae bacterium]